jgi:hypothetical protein
MIKLLIRRYRIKRIKKIIRSFRHDRAICQRINNPRITRFVFSAFTMYRMDYGHWSEWKLTRREWLRWESLIG